MRRGPVIAAGLIALMLTACSAGTPDLTDVKVPDAAAPSASPSPSNAGFDEPVKSIRGNIVKEVGQLAGMTASDGSDTVIATFVVTQIQLDPPCTSSFASPSANGHYIGMSINAETTAALADETFPTISFSEFGWQAFDTNGKRLNDPIGNAYSCLDSSQQMPPDIGPGQSVSGMIVLDVAAESGVLALLMGANAGWEWNY